MILILQLVALDIEDIDCKHWTCNVGHGNCYYSTPMLFLSRFLGAIVKRGGGGHGGERSSTTRDCCSAHEQEEY